MRNKRTTRRSGFTLVELIIAAAITSIILSSIAVLFVLALRTVKSGNAAMDANELTRAAFALMERDLNSAFTSREHGELFHFHGNEVGMSFIGLVRTYDSASNSDVVQLGRVTYVINPSLNALTNDFDDDGDGVIDNVEESDFDLIFMERLDIEDLNSNGIDDDGINGIDDGNEFNREMVDAFLPGETTPGVRTISLLRYFEPGVESLDVFDPDIKAALDSADSFTSTENGNDWRDRLTDAREALNLDDVRDAQIYDEIRRNFRRDAYIRMLANAHSFALRNDVYPDGWSLLKPVCVTCVPSIPVCPTCVPPILEKNPYDYVIAENILDIDSQLLLAGENPALFINNGAIQRFPYFLYGRIALNASSQHITEYTTTWNANANILEIADNPIEDFGFGASVGDDPTPWQSFPRDEFGTTLELGTPLEARLPEIVRVRLPFVFDSPYAGAPHVQRLLAQDIRVPSAFTRRHVNPLAGL